MITPRDQATFLPSENVRKNLFPPTSSSYYSGRCSNRSLVQCWAPARQWTVARCFLAPVETNHWFVNSSHLGGGISASSRLGSRRRERSVAATSRSRHIPFDVMSILCRARHLRPQWKILVHTTPRWMWKISRGYSPGGYHPTLIGDAFCGGCYEVVHKLGFGGYLTI